MSSKFSAAIKKRQGAFELELSGEIVAGLENFYQGVTKFNASLNLVGKCSAEEFAIRHILESLYALSYLPQNARFADIGTGAGLPGIPCLIARPDISGVLIESKRKKIDFLEKAVVECGIQDRATIVHKQFTEASDPGVSHVFCRALDGFSKKIPRLLDWSKTADILFFAGAAVKNSLDKSKAQYSERLIPMSEKRFLFHVSRAVIRET